MQGLTRKVYLRVPAKHRLVSAWNPVAVASVQFIRITGFWVWSASRNPAPSIVENVPDFNPASGEPPHGSGAGAETLRP